MINVACVWIKPKYTMSYVDKLYNSVKRNITQPFNFYCLTTHPQEVNNPNVIPIGIPVDEELENGKNKWWYKAHLFNEHNWNGQILYLDLDTVVVNNLDKFFNHRPTDFNICQDFNRHGMPKYYVSNSSVMKFEANGYTRFYKDFVENKDNIIKKFKGDQDWLTRILEEDRSWWPKEWAMSYKWEVLNGGLKRMGTQEYVSNETIINPETSILVFHGNPNPGDIADDPIIKEHWV